MTEDEVIEVGARAIWATFVITFPRKWLSELDRSETVGEAVNRRWEETNPVVKARYRDEARACLRAVGMIP